MATLELTVGIPSPKDHPFRQPSDFSGRCAVPDCGGYLVEHIAPLKLAQPAPTGNGPEVLPVALEFLTDRQEHGRIKYGTVLRAHNGRSALRDAREEAADQYMYLTQLEMEWPQLLAEARQDALREVLQLVEVAIQDEESDPTTELGRTAVAVNGALRRLHASIRSLQGKPPVEPEPVRTGPRRGLRYVARKPHRWYRPPGEGFERCRDCPLERHLVRSLNNAPHTAYRLAGEELARGTHALTRVPLCPPAPKGAP